MSRSPVPRLRSHAALEPAWRWHRKPTAADLLVATEVSDSTLRFDREQKVPSYRRGGVPEVWVVNLPEGQVEVTDELGLRVYEPGCGWGLAIESAEVHLEALFEDLEVEER